MSYWKFFPAGAADDGWGRVPMWGFAEGAEVGRVYGYLPPSTHLVVQPERMSDAGFVDATPHRAELPSAYNRYQATATDPFYRAETEPLQMLLRPLFITSFLIDDLLADEGLTERGPVVLSSASSKTAIAAAYLLSRRADAEVVGLTSEGNAEFVEGLGIYARTVLYEAVADEGGGPATFVDMAGDAGVRRAVHAAHGDDLIASVVVGATHHDAAADGGGEPLPGPRPAFFFAPDRVKKRSADWGFDGLTERAADAWHPFCSWVGEWLEVLEGEGFDALERIWPDVLDGRVPPHQAHVLKGLGPGTTSAWTRS
jgi:hypothetical protein